MSDGSAFFCTDGGFNGKCALANFTAGTCNNLVPPFSNSISSFTPVQGSDSICTIFRLVILFCVRIEHPWSDYLFFSGQDCQGDSISGIQFPGIDRFGLLPQTEDEFQDATNSFLCDTPPAVRESGATTLYSFNIDSFSILSGCWFFSILLHWWRFHRSLLPLQLRKPWMYQCPWRF